LYFCIYYADNSNRSVKSYRSTGWKLVCRSIEKANTNIVTLAV